METEIILHRGYKGRYLENSLPSFQNAIRKGMSFETDIRLSKDGKCFMLHDEELDRLLDGKGKIGDYTSQELNAVRYVMDGSHLVPLEKLFELIKESTRYNSKVFVHIKKLEDVFSVLSLNFDLRDRLRLFACDNLTWKLVEAIKGKYTNYQVGLHVTEDSSYRDKEHFSRVDFIWADEITKKSITPELVNLSHSLGKPIYAISPELIPESIFNADIQARWKELVQAGVDGICTDKPCELAQFLKNN